VVQDIKLKVDPCSYPDCRGAYVTDSRIRTPYPFFNVRWGHGPFVGARYWFTLWIVGPRGVPDGIVVTGPLNPYVPPGTPPPATTASNTPEERTPPSQPPYTPPASSQPIEMTVVQVNPALIPGYQVGPGAGTGTTQSPPPAGQSGGKVAVDPNNLKLEQVPPGAQSSTPPSGGTSTGTGMSTPPSQPPGPTTPMITSLSVTQGQPGDPVMITGSNFGPGLGEIHFVIANGRDVKAPAGAIWSDGQIFTSVPDGPDATGLLAFNGTVYVKRAGDGKVSNLAGFRFEPALRHRDIGCSPVTQDRRIQGEHQYTFLVPCVEQNGAGDLFGAKGNDEFYLSTKLSNGWVVNSVDVRQTYRYGTSGAYNWADRAGTDSPYVNVRWWRNTFSSVAYTFTVTIIGPRGVPDGIVCKQAPCSDY
jgi:hypothetical protein